MEPRFFHIDHKTRRVWVTRERAPHILAGPPIHRMNPEQYRFFLILYRARGATVTDEDLARELNWSYGTDGAVAKARDHKALRSRMQRLRRSLGEDSIRVVYGRGWALNVAQFPTCEYCDPNTLMQEK